MQGKVAECQVWGNAYAIGHILSLPMIHTERCVVEVADYLVLRLEKMSSI